MAEVKAAPAVLTIEKVAANAFEILNREQLQKLVSRLDNVGLTAHLLDLMNLPQLIELAARVAVEGIRGRVMRLTIGTEKIDQGILDYDVVGDLEYLNIIAEEMASKGTLEFEKDPLFHKVSAVITAAQIVANDMGGEDAQPILKKGEDLANLQPGTRERAEKTKEFLDELFEYLAKKLGGPPQV